MNKDEQQKQLDDLRRVIRELPENTILIVGNEHPDYPGMYGHTKQTLRIAPISPKDLQLLNTELSRVEGENKDLRSAVYTGKEVVAARDRENARLTSRVAELELLLEKALASFVVLPSRRFTEKLTDEIETALKSKEAGEEK